MFRIKSILVASFLSLFLTVGANAVTFDFRSEVAEVPGPVNYGPIDGISLTVTAFKDFSLGIEGIVEQSDNGLGVSGAPAGPELGANEALQFRFTPDVTLLSSLLFEVGDEDEFFEIRNSLNEVVHSFTVLGGNQYGSMQLVDLAPLAITDYFFTVVGLDNGFGTGAMIKEVTVAAVPVPPALMLFASALFALGILGRRRRKASLSA